MKGNGGILSDGFVVQSGAIRHREPYNTKDTSRVEILYNTEYQAKSTHINSAETNAHIHISVHTRSHSQYPHSSTTVCHGVVKILSTQVQADKTEVSSG